MTTQNKSVPALRFNEFNEDWEKKRLKEMCNKILDGTHFSPKSTEGTRKYLTSKNIRNSGLDISNINYISEEEHRNIYKRCPVKFGDVLLTKDGANTGNCCINTLKEEFSLLSSVAVLDGKADLLDNVFLLQILQSANGINTINSVMAGQAISRITLEKINDFKFLFPTLPEQQKIAAFLTAIDKKIQQLTKKKALLEQYKKGVMQKIFNQEIRFKDENGNDFADWNEKTLGELCKITTGKLDANAMKEDGEYRFYTCAKDYFKIDKFAFDTEALLISGNGANVGYIHYYNGKFNAYQRTYVLDKFSSNIIYTKYFLEKFLSLRIDKEKNEGNTPYIVLGTLKDMTINLPEESEQRKIADFFSAIDEKINLVKKQLDKTQTFKKGLLQQMFV